MIEVLISLIIFVEVSKQAGQKFSITPYITPRLTPTGTPKVISTSASPRRYSAATSPLKTSGATSPTANYDGRGSYSSWYPSSQQSSAANSPPRGRPLPGLLMLKIHNLVLCMDEMTMHFFVRSIKELIL